MLTACLFSSFFQADFSKYLRSFRKNFKVFLNILFSLEFLLWMSNFKHTRDTGFILCFCFGGIPWGFLIYDRFCKCPTGTGKQNRALLFVHVTVCVCVVFAVCVCMCMFNLGSYPCLFFWLLDLPDRVVLNSPQGCCCVFVEFSHQMWVLLFWMYSSKCACAFVCLCVCVCKIKPVQVSFKEATCACVLCLLAF